jgi:protein-disulfide isomerase
LASLTAFRTDQTAVTGARDLAARRALATLSDTKGSKQRETDSLLAPLADSRTAATVRNKTEPPVHITRREFAIGTGALTLIGAGTLIGFSLADTARPALAQNPNLAELMQPGPLGEMSLGDEKAPVTIIEYASMTCPHCANFHETTYPELKKKYIDTGKVRFIFREFPLDQLAAAAFMLARCGGKERYFPMVETLFQQQRTWAVQRPLQPLMAISKQAGLSETSFNECLKNQQVLDGIEDVRQRAANKFNVQSTPTFFVNGKQLRGAATLAEFEKEMAPYLKE